LAADEIRAIREKYNMSRALFANILHISPRTLEKWEPGTSRPNEQASTLLALTDKYPGWGCFKNSLHPLRVRY